MPPSPIKINFVYAELDQDNRWQGDIYQLSSFRNFNRLPSVDYWMLANRTCQLYEKGNRKIKLNYLVYIAVYRLEQLLNYEKGHAKFKNQIKKLIKESEKHVYLPIFPERNIIKPLMANFNMIFTVPLENCPEAEQKILQLSSPFCEHVFQKFARFYYTVGYDDEVFKTDDHFQELADQIETNFKK